MILLGTSCRRDASRAVAVSCDVPRRLAVHVGRRISFAPVCYCYRGKISEMPSSLRGQTAECRGQLYRRASGKLGVPLLTNSAEYMHLAERR